MAMPSALPRLNADEYLVLERRSDAKHELVDGELVAMTGATINHNRVTFETGRHLGNQLGGRGCEVFTQDMRVRIPGLDSYFYPDVVVACGGARTEDEHADTLLNPIVLIEVRSPATALYDRTTKLAAYSRIPTLKDYLLVAQDRPQIEHYARLDSTSDWDITIASGLDAVLEITSIDCRLTLAEIYRRVTWP